MKALRNFAFLTLIAIFTAPPAAFADGLLAGFSCGSGSAAYATGSPAVGQSSSTSCGTSASNSSSMAVVGDGSVLGFFSTQSQASTSGFATFGVLGAKASVSSMSGPASFTYTFDGNSYEIDDGLASGATAQAGGLWYDYFSNPNPFSSVTLNLGTVAHAVAGGAGGYFDAQYVAYLYPCDPSSPAPVCQNSTQVFLPSYITDTSQSWSGETTVTLAPGEVLYVQGSLLVSAATGHAQVSGGVLSPCAPPACYDPGTFGVMDGSDTAGFFVDVVTSGGSYTTASGHVYSEAALSGNEVPEPSTLLLCLSSTGVLLGLKSKRRHREPDAM